MTLACVLESFDMQSANVIGLDGPRLSRLPSTIPHYYNEIRNISILILHVSYLCQTTYLFDKFKWEKKPWCIFVIGQNLPIISLPRKQGKKKT
jgi:hypothetical protein